MKDVIGLMCMWLGFKLAGFGMGIVKDEDVKFEFSKAIKRMLTELGD